MAGITALQGLRDQRPSRRSPEGAHQRRFGAALALTPCRSPSLSAPKFTAVCSTRNVELVRSLGADHVSTTRRRISTEGKEAYELIIDNVGNHGLLDLLKAVNLRHSRRHRRGKKDPWLEPFWGMGKQMVIAPFVDQKMVSLHRE